ncbi:MAG: nucleotidyltransferase domain-containing protein [Bacteroidetes bacterium]|nr:nucleotidyltransferase domain-containing protein [Bacteroidota bacterium]
MQSVQNVQQNEFISTLSKYINLGCLSKIDIFLAAVNPMWPFYKNASQIAKMFHASRSSSIGAEVTITIPEYNGSNRSVLKIKSYLQTHLENEIYASILHGSLATDEEIGYSDFDALVILRDTVFETNAVLSKVGKHLSHCYALMIEFDPLQHHGWFVMTESDLKNYPSHYFPIEILPYSRSLTGTSQLNIKSEQSGPDKNSLIKLIKSLEKQLKSEVIPSNRYMAKGLLSEFMLLPAFFIQKITGKGIFKKFSFDTARPYFTFEEWQVMDEVSQIRIQWDASPVSSSINTQSMVTPLMKRRQKNLSGAIPLTIENAFKNGLKSRMLSFVYAVKNKSNEN